MPKFFVDFQDEGTVHRDDEGSELADFEQARNEAIGMLPQIAKDELPNGEHREFVATIRDHTGVAIYRATLTFHGEWLSTSD